MCVGNEERERDAIYICPKFTPEVQILVLGALRFVWDGHENLQTLYRNVRNLIAVHNMYFNVTLLSVTSPSSRCALNLVPRLAEDYLRKTKTESTWTFEIRSRSKYRKGSGIDYPFKAFKMSKNDFGSGYVERSFQPYAHLVRRMNVNFSGMIGNDIINVFHV